MRVGKVIVQLTLQVLHHGGLGGGQIALLADVGLQVVQLAGACQLVCVSRFVGSSHLEGVAGV